jgi:hypothetical protein
MRKARLKNSWSDRYWKDKYRNMARREIFGRIILTGEEKLTGKHTSLMLQFVLPVQMQDFNMEDTINDISGHLLVAINDVADGPVAVQPTWDVHYSRGENE